MKMDNLTMDSIAPCLFCGASPLRLKALEFLLQCAIDSGFCYDNLPKEAGDMIPEYLRKNLVDTEGMIRVTEHLLLESINMTKKMED